jgi:hypothetical protein
MAAGAPHRRGWCRGVRLLTKWMQWWPAKPLSSGRCHGHAVHGRRVATPSMAPTPGACPRTSFRRSGLHRGGSLAVSGSQSAWLVPPSRFSRHERPVRTSVTPQFCPGRKCSGCRWSTVQRHHLAGCRRGGALPGIFHGLPGRAGGIEGLLRFRGGHAVRLQLRGALEVLDRLGCGSGSFRRWFRQTSPALSSRVCSFLTSSPCRPARALDTSKAPAWFGRGRRAGVGVGFGVDWVWGWGCDGSSRRYLAAT